jgi:hypothetical protein
LRSGLAGDARPRLRPSGAGCGGGGNGRRRPAVKRGSGAGVRLGARSGS